MTRFAIVLLGLTNLALAKPILLSVPLTYATPLTPITQVDTNGGALDDQEVATARIDERTRLPNGAARSIVGTRLLRERQAFIHDDASSILASSAPLGVDGRVVDTPEVTAAKAAHAAAHVNERINLANEIARSGGSALDSSDVTNSDPNSIILDTPEVARADGRGSKIDLAKEATRSNDALPRAVNDVVPLVFGNGVVALVPVGSDGRPLNAPEVTVRSDQNLVNDVRSVDALAIAGPALAYGRLIY